MKKFFKLLLSRKFASANDRMMNKKEEEKGECIANLQLINVHWISNSVFASSTPTVSNLKIWILFKEIIKAALPRFPEFNYN